MNRKVAVLSLIMAALVITALIGLPSSSQAGEASFLYQKECWILRAYTVPPGVASQYTVMFEVVDTKNQIVPASKITGLKNLGNPVMISSEDVPATSPDISLSFDGASNTAYVFYTNGNTPHLTAVPFIMKDGPVLNIDPPSAALSFGDVTKGVSATPQTVTITNIGNADQTLGTIIKSGDAPFTIASDSCSGKNLVKTSGSCVITVGFLPTDEVSYTGALTIPYKDQTGKDQSLVVDLSGTGTVPDNGADLVVTKVTTMNANNNTYFMVTPTIMNQGISDAKAFTVQLWISADEIPNNGGKDQLLATYTVPSLGAGQSYTASVRVRFLGLPIHNYYNVIVVADTGNTVLESNEANNMGMARVFVSR